MTIEPAVEGYSTAAYRSVRRRFRIAVALAGLFAAAAIGQWLFYRNAMEDLRTEERNRVLSAEDRIRRICIAVKGVDELAADFEAQPTRSFVGEMMRKANAAAYGECTAKP